MTINTVSCGKNRNPFISWSGSFTHTSFSLTHTQHRFSFTEINSGTTHLIKNFSINVNMLKHSEWNDNIAYCFIVNIKMGMIFS